mgnify:CR=1 FL=1
MAKKAKKATKATPIKKGRRDWRTSFLAALRQSPNVSEAAEAARINRGTAYREYKINSDFAEAWEDAIGTALDHAEGELYRRGVEGVDKPVTVAGVREVIREYSDTLLIFLLKNRRREIYGERASAVNLNLTQDDLAKLTDEQLERIANGEDPLAVIASAKTGDTGDGAEKPEKAPRRIRG